MTQPYPTQSTPTLEVPPQEPLQGKKRNTPGLIALVMAVAGVIFACIPGALIVGWILLPISFILAIVSLFMKDVGHGQGIAALIISIVGTIIATFVFLFVVAHSFNEAFDSESIAVVDPESQSAAGAQNADSGTASSGSTEAGSTRDNPLAIGSTIQQGDWAVTLNSVNLDGDAAIAAENPYNSPAPAGEVYILANITAQYNGTDSTGATPWVGVDYVTVNGNSIDPTFVMDPEPFNSLETLYQGASTTGNITLSVPADTASQGTLAISPSLFGNTLFFAVQ